jgi:hypothetical protein
LPSGGPSTARVALIKHAFGDELVGGIGRGRVGGGRRNAREPILAGC